MNHSNFHHLRRDLLIIRAVQGGNRLLHEAVILLSQG